MPMLPEAPLRFSTTMRPLSCAASGSAMSRAMMSTLPPGGNGAISLIGWLGYCAAAGRAAASSAKKLNHCRRRGAIERDVSASHEAAALRGGENHHICDLFGLRHAAERQARHRALQ